MSDIFSLPPQTAIESSSCLEASLVLEDATTQLIDRILHAIAHAHWENSVVAEWNWAERKRWRAADWFFTTLRTVPECFFFGSYRTTGFKSPCKDSRTKLGLWFWGLGLDSEPGPGVRNLSIPLPSPPRIGPLDYFLESESGPLPSLNTGPGPLWKIWM